MIRPILYIIVIVVSLGFALLNVHPAYSHMEILRTSLKSLNSTSNSTDKIRELMDQTEKELSKVDPINLERFNVFLPETIDEVRFINNLSHLGILNGIILEDISVEKTEKSPMSFNKKSIDSPSGVGTPESFMISSVRASPEKKYVTTKAKFSFSASYKGALVFFDDIEKSLGLINITALSFSPQEQKGGFRAGSAAMLYRYTVGLETYSLHSPGGDSISSTK